MSANPLAHLTQHVALGDLHIGEDQLRGVLAVQSQLVQVAAARETGHTAFEHQQRQATVAVGRGAHRGDDQVRVLPVGDERLGAVDDEVVAGVDGRCADGGDVGSGAGLGHGDGRDQIAADEAGQPPVLLFGRCVRSARYGRQMSLWTAKLSPTAPQSAVHERFDQDLVVAEVTGADSAEAFVGGEAEQPDGHLPWRTPRGE